MKTPVEVCTEYAIAVESVREQTRIMRDNRCTEESDGDHITPAVPDCLSRHWTTLTGPPPLYRETPELAFEDMCENCQARHEAWRKRKEARRRLGAAKRSIEAVGKRLNKPVTA